MNRMKARKEKGFSYTIPHMNHEPEKPIEKPKSPVRRLIKMKNQGLKHKVDLKQHNAQPRHDEYAITYITDPDTFYVMKPEREINYDLAKTRPKAFYRDVFDIEVEKLGVKETH